MKKVWLLFAVLFVFLSTGCAEKSFRETQNETGSQEVSVTQDEGDVTVSGENKTKDQFEVLPDMDNNPYTTHKKDINGTVHVSWDYREVYDTLDLSGYSDRGFFGEEGIMWVEKSDYTGKRLGYIDYKGNEVVPLTDTIVEAEDFCNGYAIVHFDTKGSCAMIDATGEVVCKFRATVDPIKVYLENGNIYFNFLSEVPEEFIDPNTTNNYNSRAYMFCKSTGYMVSMPSLDRDEAAHLCYSDGWMQIEIEVGWESKINYFDETGKVVLDLSAVNEYFQEVIYASDFQEGEAIVVFTGQDGDWYSVTINKEGKWLNEPQNMRTTEAQ